MMAMPLLDRLAVADLSALRNRTSNETLELTAVPSGGPSPLWGLALSLMLAMAVVAVSIIPSKRGHQD